MRVLVSADKCVASGMCVLASSAVFSQSDADGTVEILDGHPASTLAAKVREAVYNCPAQVFTLEDENNTTEITIVKEA
jgi:ferredoxin